MHTENRFNLIDEPWIPIVDVGKVSLRKIFSDLTYRGLGGNPVQKIALTKLLLAIVQAAYTPRDDEDWALLGTKGVAEKCLSYLDQWHDRFWLYGERPFLQMPQIIAAEEQSFGAVLPEVATGNTTVLIASQKEKPLLDGEKALVIVSLMGFGLGGKKTDNSVVLTPGYQGKCNEKGKSSTGKPGTSISFLGLLHNFLIGKTLLETLWLNQCTSNQLQKMTIYPSGVGVAPWEKMPEGEQCGVAQRLQKSLMGRLVPLSRFCLLTENGLHYSEGIYHPNHKDGVVDPSVAVNFSGKEVKVIWCDPQRRPWRYLTALLSFMLPTNSGGFDCYQIRDGLGRARAQIKNIGIWSGGLKVSSNAGEQYVAGGDDFIESSISLESNFLGENWYQKLTDEMNELNQLSKMVYSATLGFFKSQQAEGKRQADRASNLYWQLCERHFQSLVSACNDISKVKEIRKTFARCVNKAYNSFCSKDTARQLEAWAAHLPKLHKYLN